jgi:hypothetical protein
MLSFLVHSFSGDGQLVGKLQVRKSKLDIVGGVLGVDFQRLHGRNSSHPSMLQQQSAPSFVPALLDGAVDISVRI